MKFEYPSELSVYLINNLIKDHNLNHYLLTVDRLDRLKNHLHTYYLKKYNELKVNQSVYAHSKMRVIIYLLQMQLDQLKINGMMFQTDSLIKQEYIKLYSQTNGNIDETVEKETGYKRKKYKFRIRKRIRKNIE